MLLSCLGYDAAARHATAMWTSFIRFWSVSRSYVRAILERDSHSQRYITITTGNIEHFDFETGHTLQVGTVGS